MSYVCGAEPSNNNRRSPVHVLPEVSGGFRAVSFLGGWVWWGMFGLLITDSNEGNCKILEFVGFNRNLNVSFDFICSIVCNWCRINCIVDWFLDASNFIGILIDSYSFFQPSGPQTEPPIPALIFSRFFTIFVCFHWRETLNRSLRN